MLTCCGRCLLFATLDSLIITCLSVGLIEFTLVTLAEFLKIGYAFYSLHVKAFGHYFFKQALFTFSLCPLSGTCSESFDGVP